MQPNVSELQHIDDMISFNIRVHNLKLLNFSQVALPLAPDLPLHQDQRRQPLHLPTPVARLHLPRQNMDSKPSSTQSSKSFTTEIQGPLSMIANKIMVISIQDKLGNAIDQLKMKLSYLSTGPIKHDHLLKNLKSRFLFDCRVDQYMDTEVSISDFSLRIDKADIYREEQYLLTLMVILSRYSSPT